MIRVLLLWVLLAQAAMAIGPEEVMEDPALHTRAMDLYDALRCVRCRSESIASSNADWAQDARAVVRERLLVGDSNQQVLDFFQLRYDDYVLMNPPVRPSNIALWIAGPVLLIGGATLLWLTLWRRKEAEPQAAELSDAERAKLAQLSDQDAGI